MKCPYCGGKTYVTTSYEKNEFVVRYRKCRKCNKTTKTRELTDSDWIYKNVVKQLKDILDNVDV